MVAAASTDAYTPSEPPQLSVAGDGTLAAVLEACWVTIVELPSAAAFAEIRVDPEAMGHDIAWVGSPPRLLILSRYAAASAVHLLDPDGPRAVAEIRLEAPMRLVASVGATALVIGTHHAGVLTASEANLVPHQFLTRTLPTAAGAAARQFVVALRGSIEEWDPQSRMPNRRLRLQHTPTITAVGGSERVVWMTTQSEPTRLSVIPLVNRGQPKVHDLPEPIAWIAGHPRSDLVACIGESGRLYAVDLDGRTRLRELGNDAAGHVASAALVVGRMVGVLAAQAGQPLALWPLDGRERAADAESIAPRAVVPQPAREPVVPIASVASLASEVSVAEVAADEREADGSGELDAQSGEAGSVAAGTAWAEVVEVEPVDTEPARFEPSAPAATAELAPLAVEPVPDPPPPAEPSSPSGEPARGESHRRLPPRSPFAVQRTMPVKPGAGLFSALPHPGGSPRAAGTAGADASTAATAGKVSAAQRPVPSVSERVWGWRDQLRQHEPPVDAVLRLHRATEPPMAAAPSSWRDDVVAWTRRAMAGTTDGATDAPAPDAPLIDAIVARFELSSALRPALVLLYGAHLCGQHGAAPVDVARLLGGAWREALGGGELSRGVADHVASRVVLSPAVLRVLDELPPATGVLVGGSGEPGGPGGQGRPALASPCVVVAGGEPLAVLAEAVAARISGAILAVHAGAELADAAREARACGATPMFWLPASLDALPGGAAILVTDDAGLAERLGLPRLL